MFEEQRHQAGLPVVRMDKFRLPGQVAGQVRDALGKENESFGVVRKIHSALCLIQAAAIEELGLLNKVHSQPWLPFAYQNPGRDAAASQRQVHSPVKRANVGEFFQDARVERRDQPDLQAGLSQGLRERARHVGQATRLRVGMDLAAGEQDFHRQKTVRVCPARDRKHLPSSVESREKATVTRVAGGLDRRGPGRQ